MAARSARAINTINPPSQGDPSASFSSYPLPSCVFVWLIGLVWWGSACSVAAFPAEAATASRGVVNFCVGRVERFPKLDWVCHNTVVTVSHCTLALDGFSSPLKRVLDDHPFS